MHTPLVKLQAIRNLYTLDKGDVTSLRDVSLAIDAGGFMALSGASDSRKTTLLNLTRCLQPFVAT